MLYILYFGHIYLLFFVTNLLNIFELSLITIQYTVEGKHFNSSNIYNVPASVLAYCVVNLNKISGFVY